MALLDEILSAPVETAGHNTLWVARKVSAVAASARNHPDILKAALCDAEAEFLSGALSDEAYCDVESEIIIRLAPQLL